ncbi:MAG: hypothetical protein EXS13_06465 [Planctomycetes bacterium]|nr:hypothetical protein [Planctomycetota bacterium]
MSSRLGKRLLFGPLLIALVGGGLWLDAQRIAGGTPPLWSPLLATLIALASVKELLQLLAGTGCVLPRWPLLAVSASLLLAKTWVEYHGLEPRAAWHSATLAAATIFVAALLLRERDVSSGIARAGGAALVLLVTQLLSTLIDVVYDFGPFLLFALVISTKAGDMGAYLVGKSCGRHKLIPHVSPGKTVEGAIGGLAAAMAVACWLIGHFGGRNYHLFELLAVGALLFVAGHVGDLFESLWKRAAKVKDSGQLLPEFGGALDLVDSLLFAVPAGYALLRLFAD